MILKFKNSITYSLLFHNKDTYSDNDSEQWSVQWSDRNRHINISLSDNEEWDDNTHLHSKEKETLIIWKDKKCYIGMKILQILY